MLRSRGRTVPRADMLICQASQGNLLELFYLQRTQTGQPRTPRHASSFFLRYIFDWPLIEASDENSIIESLELHLLRN